MKTILRNVVRYTIFAFILWALFFNVAKAETLPFDDSVTDWSGICYGGPFHVADLWVGSCRVQTEGRNFTVTIKPRPVNRFQTMPRQIVRARVVNRAPNDLQPSFQVTVDGLFWLEVFPRSLELQAFFRARGTVTRETELLSVEIRQGDDPTTFVLDFKRPGVSR